MFLTCVNFSCIFHFLMVIPGLALWKFVVRNHLRSLEFMPWGSLEFLPAVAFLNLRVSKCKCRICGFTWQAKCWEEYTRKPNDWPKVVNSYR